MKLQTVVTVLGAEVVSRQVDLLEEVQWGAAADLMSDVLAFACPDSLLLTGLTHPQAVRAADMAGVRAIAFVRAKRPPVETIDLAEELGIPLLRTRYTMYEACGLLYQAGLAGQGPCEAPDAPKPVGT